MSYTKYISLARITLQDLYSSKLEAFMRIFILGVVLFVFLQLWLTIFAGRHTLEGYTIAQMLWYYLIAELIFFATGTERIETLGEEIKNGSIGTTLLKPMSFIGRELTIQVVGAMNLLIMLGVPGIVLVLLLVGPISVHVLQIPFILLGIVAGIFLNIVISLIFAMLSLWLEDTTALYWLYTKVLFVFGGLLVPLDFLPTWVLKASVFLPTTFIMYMPAKLSVSFEWILFARLVLGQVLWISIALLLLYTIWRLGKREVTLNGG